MRTLLHLISIPITTVFDAVPFVRLPDSILSASLYRDLGRRWW